MKVVCINGKAFCKSTINDVNHVFGKVAKKIIEFSTIISVVI